MLSRRSVPHAAAVGSATWCTATFPAIPTELFELAIRSIGLSTDGC